MKNILKSDAYAKAKQRAVETLKLMNLTEKIGQLSQFGTSIYTDKENLFTEYYKEGKIGAYLTIKGAKKTNQIQKELIEESPHHIPALFGEDVIHGYRTTMPSPLTQSYSWNPEVVRRGCEVAAKEASSAGIKWVFSPMVDIARDPRWGRVMEGYGEDTYLCSRMSEAAVLGYQGELDGGRLAKDRVYACMKHYIAYGAAIGGRDYNTTDLSMQTLHDVYLPPFAAGVNAGAATVMSAFEDINGTPATANKYFLTDVLKEQLGFNGFVVSDAGAVPELVLHGFAENSNDASVKAFDAGCDMIMQLMGDYYNKALPAAIEEGKISIEQVDEAVTRILTLKYLSGIMDEPFTEESREDCFFCDEHLEVAKYAALESAVLLENNGTLPLKGQKKIALVGALAGDEGKRHLLGAWSCCADHERTVTIEEGLKRELEGKAEIIYSYGCSVCENGSDEDEERIAEAVEAAAQSDVVICVAGEYASRSGEASSFANIHLPGNQEKLIDALVNTGKPVVVLVVSGRANVLSAFNKKVDALMLLGHPGTCAGYAVAELLTGKATPSGHITLTHPRCEGQIPIYYNCNSTGRPDRPGGGIFKVGYKDLPDTPLYCFGYGLSYTKFDYTDIKLSSDKMGVDGTIEVSLKVRNVGEYNGAAVVQMYIRDLVGSRVRPVKELKGFEKVRLGVGEEKEVKFTLTADSLSFHDANMQRIVEPGKFKLWIAEDSSDKSREFDFEIV